METCKKIEKKADIQDVCALVDMKADSSQVSLFCDEIKKSISMITGKIDGDIS